MKKVLFSNSKARLFGTLNRNDFKIKISISFICDSGGKLIPCETKEWEEMEDLLFSLLLLFLFLFAVPLSLFTPTPFFGTGKLGNFVVFPRPKRILSSELGIKFKWKLDGIPGEETGLWGIWITDDGKEEERDDSVCPKMGFVFQRFRRICGKRVDVVVGKPVVFAHSRTPCPCLFILISFVLEFLPLKIMATFKIAK